ncbi:Uncharacterized protein PHSC3_000055 [Chlamydiales bacterium STE3]|nr:Uncharacterized protein PHSC3_000055 [Chlamydiales bacterium STE3]
MGNDALYQRNLNFLSKKQPILANLLPFLISNPWNFCRTGKKLDLNLQKEIDGKTITVYSAQNIQVELRQWVGMHNLRGIDWIVVYGLGLGYHYETLHSWLKENPEHHLVFLEDDLSVIQRFLETEKAEAFLNDSQVELFYVDLADPQDNTLDVLARKFMYQNMLFLPITSYEKYRLEEASKIQFLIDFKKSGVQMFIGEYLERGSAFFKNFYRNLFQYPYSLQGNHLWKHFEGVPAIICGAGPSLQKNIELLKTLKDRALVFAGGTAMNALNVYGLTPHFGLGVDPFPAQFTRLIMNCGFETPFFYRSRMNAQALEMIHGQKLYLAGASGYPIANWFDEKLHLQHPNLDEGCNVINMSLSIAEALGCNPIICVGVDLAYSQGQSYAPGIEMHAIHDTKENLITKSTEEELVLQNDIYGQPIYTLWKWIQESVWFSHFAHSHPNLTFLNATEGGIGFKGVPNVTLEEAAKQFLHTQYDFESRLHGEMLSIAMPEDVNKRHIKEVLQEFVESLNRCIEILKEIYSHNPELWEEKKPVVDEALKPLEDRLKQENAYKVLLKVFDENYNAYIKISTAEATASSKILNQLSGRFAYLMEIAVENLRYIDQALQKENKLEALLPVADKIAPHQQRISYEERDNQENLVETHFKNGLTLKQFVVHGQLEGPSILVSKDNTLLAQSDYVNGKKMGKARFFYPNGQIASLQEFKEGLAEGKQEYYYDNGTIKSRISYKEGRLDGEVMLFYPNEQIKRHLQFSKGKRHGFDRIYDELGMLKIEAEYEQGKPKNSARMWHSNGSLAKEVLFDGTGMPIKTQVWDKEGHFLPDHARPLDYFDQVTQQTGNLTTALDQMVQKLEDAVVSIAEEERAQGGKTYDWVEQDLHNLNAQLAELKKIGEDLTDESGVKEGAQEPLWKTPSSKKLIQQYLEVITGTMQETMKEMTSELNTLQKMVREKEEKKTEDKYKS